ncbi:phage tail protein [Thalassospira sp. TSL5-1]|uniref:phage tail protein n=1 Tax=Thalassospira sp. TSL5-1 TaxID=1544451 RepID=UPI000A800C3D|nr:tail fiber protein [Thalassospira sp. TSL5-1]
MRDQRRLKLFGNFLAGASAIIAMTYLPKHALACNEEEYMGSICWTVGSKCPEKYMPADGRSLQVGAHTPLFNIIGYKYGGSDFTFNLPNLMGREPVGIGTGPGLTPIRAGTPVNGSESQLISQDQLPQHEHGVPITASQGINVNVQSGAGNERSPAGHVLAAPQGSDINLYAKTEDGEMAPGIITANIAGQTVTTSMTPDSPQTKISVLGPQLGLLACVNVYGVYEE